MGNQGKMEGQASVYMTKEGVKKGGMGVWQGSESDERMRKKRRTAGMNDMTDEEKGEGTHQIW